MESLLAACCSSLIETSAVAFEGFGKIEDMMASRFDGLYTPALKHKGLVVVHCQIHVLDDCRDHEEGHVHHVCLGACVFSCLILLSVGVSTL